MPQLARDKPSLFKLAQVKVDKRAADADFASELAHIDRAVRLQRLDDSQAMRMGQGRQHLQQPVSVALQIAPLPESSFTCQKILTGGGITVNRHARSVSGRVKASGVGNTPCLTNRETPGWR